MKVKNLCIIGFMLFGLGCGIKGDPLPPLVPTEIGRGRPTYKRAMEEVADPNTLGEESEGEEEGKKRKSNEGF